MQLGKYNLESLNNGKYILTWYDNELKRNFKHIINDINAIFDPVADLAVEKSGVKLVNKFIKEFIIYCDSLFTENKQIADIHYIDFIDDRIYNALMNGDGMFLNTLKYHIAAFNICYSVDIKVDEVLRDVRYLQKYYTVFERQSAKAPARLDLSFMDGYGVRVQTM